MRMEMKVLRDVFSEMVAFAFLEEAYRNARKQKRYRDEVLVFSSDLDANLLRIQDALLSGTFVFGPYRRHWVFIPKRRLVMALPFDSRIVQWSVYLMLNPFFDRLMIEDSFACRVGKGSLAAALRVQYWLKQVEGKKESWYILKLDISKYFYRVDHEILIDILQRRIDDERLMELLRNIISCDGERFGLPRFMGPDDVDDSEWLPDIGMPIGNLTSQMFANIYLNEVDQFCKHALHIHMYARYMDDIVVIAPTKELAHEWQEQIGTFLSEKLHLDLNRKTSIMPANRVEFVGFIVTPDELRLRKQTVRRIKSAFRGICSRYFAGELTQEQFDRRVASYDGMIKHCAADGLRQRLNEIYLREKEKAMNLQLIEELCSICSELAGIVSRQQQIIAQHDAVIFEEEIAGVRKRFRDATGEDLDNFTREGGGPDA